MVESFKSVPADLLRTLIVVSETGNASQAARKLGISQPAVTSQIARLEKIFGRPLIERMQDGQNSTRLGRLVLDTAQRLLKESGPQIQPSAAPKDDRIRIGVSSIFIERFARDMGKFAAGELALSSAVCPELAQAFAEDELDVVMALDVRDNREKLNGHIVEEHPIEMIWVTTPAFEAKEGAIPLAIWPGDGLAVRTLDAAGCDYRVMFSTNDYFAKLSAVESGAFISMMPRNALRAPFIETKDKRLPPLPTPNAMIAVRGHAQNAQMRHVRASLSVAHLG